MGASTQSDGESLLAALNELLTTPKVTKERFQGLLLAQPGLLGDGAQMLLSAIAAVQESAAARDQVHRLARLLAFCARHTSVEDALSGAADRLNRQSAKERREARLLMAGNGEAPSRKSDATLLSDRSPHSPSESCIFKHLALQNGL
jgi:hypothetical protein